MTSTHDSNFLDDPKFQSLLVGCLESLQRNESIDREALANDYPKYAQELERFLRDRQLLEEVASELGEVEPSEIAISAYKRTVATSTNEEDPVVGDTIRYIGEYEILGEIARGGMGIVFKARQQKLWRVVALKMLLAGRLADDDDIQRFYREARASGQLKHPHIVPVHEIGEHEGRHYFTMDFIDGRSLAEEIREESLAPQRAAEIVRIVAEAVQFAHDRGTVHRDLKPANVLLTPDDSPHITDFGLAKMLQSVDEPSRAELTASGQIFGTPSYMSPEQASGKRELVGPASDVYSLGAILYACLTGRAPFVADSPVDTLLQVMKKEPVSPRELNPSIPRDLETICLKCLTKEPHKRYGTARELAEDLNRFLTGQPVVARRIGALSRIGRWCRRNPVIAGLSATVLTLLLVVTAGSLFSTWKINRSLKREAAQRQAAESQQREATRQLSRFSVSNGVRLLKEERLIPALCWFAEALDAEQDIEHRASIHQTRIATWINQCPRLLNLWTIENRRQWKEPSAAGPREVAANFGSLHDLDVRFTADGSQVLVAINRETALHYAYGLDAAAERTTAKSVRWGEVCVVDADGNDATAVISGRDSGLMTPAISSDGRYVALQRPAGESDGGSNDGYELAVFNTVTGQEIGKPVVLKRQVARAAFSPNGELLATAVHGSTGLSGATAFERAGEVQIWNVTTGELAASPIELPPQWVNALQFTPDGKRLVVGGPGARVWDLSSSQWLTTKLHDDNVRHIALSRDGRRLATAVPISGGRGEVRVWDIETGEAVSPVWPHPGFVSAIVFSPGAEALLVVGSQTAQVWNVGSGRRMNDLLIEDESVQGAAYSHNGTRVVTWGKSVRVWNAESWQPVLPALEHVDPVRSACFSPDSERLLTATASGTTRLWELDAPGMPVEVVKHDGEYLRAAFSPDGEQFVTSNGDVLDKAGEARRWLVESGQQVLPALDHPCGVWNITFSGDGRWLFTGSGRLDHFGALTAWDAATGRRIGTAESTRPVLDVAANHDGSQIVTYGRNVISTKRFEYVRTENPNESLAGWNVARWALDDAAGTIRRLNVLDEDDSGWSTGAGISVDPRREFVCVARSRSAEVFRFDTGEPVASPIEVGGVGVSASIQCAEIALDGKRLLTISGGQTASDGYARIWDIRSGKPVTAPFAADGGHFASFSPDGRLVVTCRGSSARVWDAATGEPRTQPLVHRAMVYRACFDATNRLIVTASQDRTARIWDAETGQPVAPPLPHGSSVTSVAFHPSGSDLLTTATGGICRLWQIQSPETTGSRWQSLVHSMSGGRIDDTGTLVAIEPGELKNAWSNWRVRHFDTDSKASP